MVISATHALALRRLAIGTGALAASVVAHRCAVGDLDTTAATPVVWLGLLSMLTLVGGRFRWRPRGLPATLAIMVAAQAGVHVAMSGAPWAFGLVPHHEPAIAAGPAALAAHAVAALVLALLVVRLETILDRAVRAVRAVRRWLSARPRPIPAERILAPAQAAPRQRARGAASCRGPPLPSIA